MNLKYILALFVLYRVLNKKQEPTEEPTEKPQEKEPLQINRKNL